MGDMADFALDQVMDEEEDRFAYRMGEMSDGEAYDRGIIDELGFSNHPPMFKPAQTLKQCAHCGTNGLHWAEIGTGWRLVTANGDVHTCAAHPSRKLPPLPGAPGTISARFKWLCGELEKRLGEVNPVLSAPPEAELIRRLDKLLADRG